MVSVAVLYMLAFVVSRCCCLLCWVFFFFFCDITQANNLSNVTALPLNVVISFFLAIAIMKLINRDRES